MDPVIRLYAFTCMHEPWRIAARRPYAGAHAIYHRTLQFGVPVLKYVPFAWLVAPLVVPGIDAYCKYDVERRYGARAAAAE